MCDLKLCGELISLLHRFHIQCVGGGDNEEMEVNLRWTGRHQKCSTILCGRMGGVVVFG